MKTEGFSHHLSALVIASIAWVGFGGPALAQETRQPAPVIPPASDNDNPGSVLAIGGDGSSAGYSAFAAGTFALNGDLYADGVLLRASGGVGEYNAGVKPFVTDTDVTFYNASLLVGYQKRLGDVNVTGFVGPELIHNGRGADPRVRGTEIAARVIGEIYAPGESVDLSVWSTYSTFENQYFINARALVHDMPPAGGIGPDVSLFGGDGWQRMRAGAHVSFPTTFGQVGVSSGYDWDLKGDVEESLYGSLILSLPF